MTQYAKLNSDQRRAYIQNANNARKRRTSRSTTEDVRGNEENVSNRNIRQRIDCLLRGQLIPYEYQGKKIYNPNCSSLNELEIVPHCIHCGAKKFQFEPPTFCCYNGQIKLATTEVPAELEELFISQSDEGTDFRRHIRAYNSIFSFTSFGVKLDKELASSRRGIYTFRAQGQVYHDLPPLTPQQSNPCYLQLYFYDTDNEVHNRVRILQGADISETVVRRLMNVLHQNPYSRFFRRLKDFSSIENVEIRIAKDTNLDQRVYNSPSSDQVAAIWVEGNNSNIPFEREIIVHAHSGHRHRVKHYFGCYDPLQYPLLFPKGEFGWQQNIRKGDGCRRRNIQEENSTTSRSFSSTQEIFYQEQEGNSVKRFYIYF